MTLTGNEFVKVLTVRRVTTVGPEDASRVVDGAIANEFHILSRADVLAKVDLVEAIFGAVSVKSTRATREATRSLVEAGALGHLPREEAVRDRDDLITRALLHLRVRGEEGENRAVVAIKVVGVGQTLLDGIGNLTRRHGIILPQLFTIRTKELGVATGHVAVAHDVAKHHDVLRLGDDRLGVAGEVALDRLDRRVGGNLPVN